MTNSLTVFKEEHFIHVYSYAKNFPSWMKRHSLGKATLETELDRKQVLPAKWQKENPYEYVWPWVYWRVRLGSKQTWGSQWEKSVTRDGVVCDCVTCDGVSCGYVTHLAMESSGEKWADLSGLGTQDIFLAMSHSAVCMCWKL